MKEITENNNYNLEMEEIKENNKSIINKIRSKSIIIKIYSFLNGNKKLNIIKYNKYLQKKLYIDLEYFKLISGIYIDGERNGKGKEYFLDTNKLIFEGEYLNGKRNGKGKEYINDMLVFEGEYLNGKRNGKGKEYYNENKLKFEGEYLDGKMWNGKGYDIMGNLEFELKNGKGKEYINDILVFEGEYLNGKRNGKGKEYNKHGKIEFEGEYLDGKIWNGKKYDYIDGSIVEFEYLNGKPLS